MNQIKQKRKELGITQIQAARACGVSRRTYQTYEENNISNATANEIYRKLDEMGVIDGSNYIPNVRYIKYVCREVFSTKYPQVECAYLYGSYARGEATGKSDIDILIILKEPMGLKFYSIASELEKQLHKDVDVQSYETIVDNAAMLRDILTEGIKIYG